MNKKESIKKTGSTTVMFANFSGFSAMSGKISPDRITSLMNDCFSRMEEIINRYGGISEKFIGDSIMVTFNTTTRAEDSAKKSIIAALEMREEIYRFNKYHSSEHPLEIQIGIESGVYQTGSKRIGEKAKSDAVNMALKLEETSIKGQILIGPSAYETTKKNIIYRTINPVTYQEEKDPAAVFEVLTTKENLSQSKPHFERLTTSRIIGRKLELEILDNEIENTIKGTGSIIMIIGEAGIGKTKLITEFKDSKTVKKVKCLEGKSISIGRNLSFHPVLEIINKWTGIDENDTDTIAFKKLESSVNELSSESGDEILPFMCMLLGINLPRQYSDRIKNIEGEALEKMIIKTISSILIKGSSNKPLVLIFEDIHWADNSSLGLIESLFWLVKSHKITFILLTRPGYPDTGDRIIRRCREHYHENYTELELAPFNKKECEQMLSNFIDIRNLDKVWRERIISRSSGHPYFIEEVIRSLIDYRALEFSNNIYEVTQKINEIKIPYSLNELLLTRIERLDDDTRNLLINASVIGKNFLYKILKEISSGIDNIDTRLNLLKKVELILEDTRSEEIEFFFKHTLAQEAAYESILVNRRKKIHLEVAQSIEKIFKNRLQDFYGMLAYHYSSAEKPDKAEEYMIKAGNEALKSSASSEAIHYFQEALNIYNRLNRKKIDREKITLVEKNLATAFFNKGQYENSLKYFDRVLKQYGDEIPQNKFLMLLKFLVNIVILFLNLFLPLKRSNREPGSREQEIISMFHKRLTILAVVAPRRFFIESIYQQKMLINFNLKKIFNGVGMFSATSNTFAWTGISYGISKKILDYCKNDITEEDKRSKLLYNFSVLLFNFLTGKWDHNIYDDQLINENLKIGELFFSSAVVLWFGYFQVEQGYYQKTMELVNKLSSTGNIYSHDYTIALKYELHNRLLIKYGKLEEAKANLDEGINFTRSTDILNVCFVLLTLQVRAHALLQQPDEAEIYLRSADEIKEAIYPVPFHINYYMISKFFYFSYRLKKALDEKVKKSIPELLRELKVIKKYLLSGARKTASDRVEAYRLVFTFYHLTGKQTKAFKYIRKSIIEGENLNARVELARTYLDAGKFLLSNDNNYKEINGINGMTYIKKSEELFEKTGIKYDPNEFENETPAP